MSWMSLSYEFGRIFGFGRVSAAISKMLDSPCFDIDLSTNCVTYLETVCRTVCSEFSNSGLSRSLHESRSSSTSGSMHGSSRLVTSEKFWSSPAEDVGSATAMSESEISIGRLSAAAASGSCGWWTPPSSSGSCGWWGVLLPGCAARISPIRIFIRQSILRHVLYRKKTFPIMLSMQLVS